MRLRQPPTALRNARSERTHRNRSREKSVVVSRAEKRDALPSAQVLVLAARYAAYCQAAKFSGRTIETRQATIQRLSDFLRDKEYSDCGSEQLIEFAGNLSNRLNGKELRPWTAVTIYGHLRCFFNWLVEQNILDESPHEAVPRPILRKDQKIPHSSREIELLLTACRESYFPSRNAAMVRLMVDTGIRATELCTLKFGNLSMAERTVTVMGKGNKVRVLSFGVQTSRALWRYLHIRNYIEGESDGEALFVNQSGKNQGMAMNRLGLLQLIGDLAKTKGFKSNPHRLRHTFAVNYIINGGDAFSLMLQLGHTDLQTSNEYVLLAQSNVAAKHAQFSPMDNMGF